MSPHAQKKPARKGREKEGWSTRFRNRYARAMLEFSSALSEAGHSASPTQKL